MTKELVLNRGVDVCFEVNYDWWHRAACRCLPFQMSRSLLNDLSYSNYFESPTKLDTYPSRSWWVAKQFRGRVCVHSYRNSPSSYTWRRSNYRFLTSNKFGVKRGVFGVKWLESRIQICFSNVIYHFHSSKHLGAVLERVLENTLALPCTLSKVIIVDCTLGDYS